MSPYDPIRALLDEGQFGEALQRCERSIRDTGGTGELALLTAQALVGLARLQEAETWVQRARLDLPEDDTALRLLAQIYRRRGWRVRAEAIERRLQPATGPRRGTPVPSDSMLSLHEPGAAPPPRDTVVPPTMDGADEARSSTDPEAAPDPAATPPDAATPDEDAALAAAWFEAPASKTADRSADPGAPAPGPSDEATAGIGEPDQRPPAAPAQDVSVADPAADPTSPAIDPPRPARPAAPDRYEIQRRRTRALLVISVVGVVALAVAAVWAWRGARDQRITQVLARTQALVDSADYDALLSARDDLREAIGGAGSPEGALCARAAEVELLLWHLHTGDRAYLQQARELLEMAETRDPGGAEALHARALWEGLAGDPLVTTSTARTLLADGAVREDRALRLQGLAAAALGDHGKARRRYEQAAGTEATALNLLAFARAAERAGQRTDATDQLSAILEIRADHRLATIDLALLRAGTPGDDGYVERIKGIQAEHDGQVPARAMSRILHALARGYIAAGERSDAIELLEQAVEEDRENPALRLQLARERWASGRFEEAFIELSVLERQQPRAGDVLAELALVAYLQDRPGPLAERLDDAPGEARASEAYRLALGALALLRGDPESASERLDVEPGAAQVGPARVLLAEARRAAGDLQGAWSAADEAVAHLRERRGDRDPLVAWAELSREAMRVRGASAAAVALSSTARRRGGALGASGRGQLAELRGDLARAAGSYWRASLSSQGYGRALAGFVRCARADRGRRSDVARAAETYLKLAPDGPHAALMREVTAD